MYNFTIPMALMDFVPVVFFGITAILLLRDMYNKMAKGAYALLAAGSVNVFLAGFAKLCGNCCMQLTSATLWPWKRCSCQSIPWAFCLWAWA